MDKRIIEIGRKNAVVHMILNVAETTNMDEKETLISIILDLVQFNEIFLKRNSELLDLCVNPIPFIVKGGIVPGEKPGKDRVPIMFSPEGADWHISEMDLKTLKAEMGGKMKCTYCDSDDVTMMEDPLFSEIYGDTRELPLCGNCEWERRNEI